MIRRAGAESSMTLPSSSRALKALASAGIDNARAQSHDRK
jgi:hypothetical protein